MHRYITQKIAYYFRIDAGYFFSGALWLLIIQAITVLGALIVSVVMAHVLTEAAYGTYRYILGIGTLLSALSLTGIGQSIFQTAALGYTRFYSIGIKKSNIYGILLILCSIIASGYYAVQQNTTLSLGCLLIACFQPFLNTYQQIFPFLQGTQQFKESTLLQGVKTAIVTVVALVSVFVTQDILWLVFSYFISTTLSNYVIHLFYAPKESPDEDPTLNERYLSYAYNTSLRNIISIIAFRIDSIIVFQQLGAAQLAVYTIANILPEHIKASFKNMSTLLVPKYALHGDLATIRKSLLKRSLQLFCITVLVLCGYMVIATPLYTLLFPKYDEAVFLSQMIALSFPAMTALIPLSALQAHTKEIELSRLNTTSSIITIVITALFTVVYGLIGAVLARIVSRYITLFLTYYYFLRE